MAMAAAVSSCDNSDYYEYTLIYENTLDEDVNILFYGSDISKGSTLYVPAQSINDITFSDYSPNEPLEGLGNILFVFEDGKTVHYNCGFTTDYKTKYENPGNFLCYDEVGEENRQYEYYFKIFQPHYDAAK